MFAKFDEIAAIASRYYGNKTLRMDGRTHTDNAKTVLPPTKFAGVYLGKLLLH